MSKSEAKPQPLPHGFDLDNPKLPKAIDAAALASGGFPYESVLPKDDYETQLNALQIELQKLQSHMLASGDRVVCVFEGRDAAGKGSAIKRLVEHMNPRHTKVVALTKPTDAERGQWYFQRYIVHMPTAGDLVVFDRSWYNRAGVERVMGFCTADQLADFLREAPHFEGMLTRDGVHVFKFYLDIGREMQLKRFHKRRHDPLKRWKITPIDEAAMAKWDEYTKAKEEMFRFTHTAASPWTVIRANDKRRTRLEAIRTILLGLDYKDKSAKAIGDSDRLIVGSSNAFFYDQP